MWRGAGDRGHLKGLAEKSLQEVGLEPWPGLGPSCPLGSPSSSRKGLRDARVPVRHVTEGQAQEPAREKTLIRVHPSSWPPRPAWGSQPREGQRGSAQRASAHSTCGDVLINMEGHPLWPRLKPRLQGQWCRKPSPIPWGILFPGSPPPQACLVTDSFLRLSTHFLPPFPSSLSIQGSVWPPPSRSLL